MSATIKLTLSDYSVRERLDGWWRIPTVAQYLYRQWRNPTVHEHAGRTGRRGTRY